MRSMGAKVFVLGMPGCGKSTATHYIKSFAQKKGYTVRNFNDYTILRERFEAAPDGPEFRRADNDGFDIHDFTVLDTSLRELERRVLQEEFSENEIITIEFARNDYSHALQQFSLEFLQDSYFLFIQAEKPTCKKRTRKRAEHPVSSDDHFVSDYVFDKYYCERSSDCVSSILSFVSLLPQGNQKIRNANMPRVTVLNNSKHTSKANFSFSVMQFTWQMVGRLDLMASHSKTKHVKRIKSINVKRVESIITRHMLVRNRYHVKTLV